MQVHFLSPFLSVMSAPSAASSGRSRASAPGASSSSSSDAAGGSTVGGGRTLIHFKKNSRHAVSQALAQLQWSEVRLRIPRTGGSSTASVPTVDAGEEEEDDESPEAEEMDETAAAVAAAAMSDVKSRPKKVKQPKAMLLNMHAFTAVYPTTGRTCAAAGLAWDIAWLDALSEDEYRSLGRAQRINQFPMMHRLTKKKYLALNLNRMRALEPEEFSFYPRSWVLPQELPELKEYYAQIASTKAAAIAAGTPLVDDADSNLATTPILIVKPDFACEGKGIYLVDRLSSIDLSIPLVVQQYVARPMLLAGVKYDLRLYCLMTSVSPLSIFLFDDGLTRFCTDAYEPPRVGRLGSSFQHLTNYAINKKNGDKFVFNTDANQDDFGSKWSVKRLFEKLRSEGRDVDLLWRRICDLVNKSILSSYGPLSHAYKTTFTGPLDVDGGNCFQFLGFDVMIDDEFRPILIEINRNCSLRCDTPLDARVKVRAISQTLEMVDPRAPHRARDKEAAARDREALRALSGAAYKEAIAAQQQARYDARLRHEDACIANFAAQGDVGSFQRIYPAVHTYHAADAAAPGSQVAPPTAYALERQAVYDRLMTRAVAARADAGKAKKSGAVTTAGARRTLSGRAMVAKMRAKVAPIAASVSSPSPELDACANEETPTG